jgi:hypothetical protein
MRLALITIVFLLHSQTFAATPIATEKPAKKAVASAHQPGATVTRMKFQPGQEAARLNAAHGTPQARQATPNPPAIKDTSETEGLPYGTLLATLVLMAAIAVRRSRAGRP